MERNHLTAFEVGGFKKFARLKIEDIGQYNLIVGDNNVGKTSLLEALMCHENPHYFLDALDDIMLYVKRFNNLREPVLSYFFSTFGTTSPVRMYFREFFSGEPAKDLGFTKYSGYRFSTDNRSADNSSLHEIDSDNGQIKFHKKEVTGAGYFFNINIPYIPFGNYYTHELTEKYSEYIQVRVDKKSAFVHALRVLIPGLENIEVNAGFSSTPVLLIAEEGKNNLQPLGMYGDGALKIFRILLSIFSDKQIYSRLMIDELDAGVHHSRLTGFISALLTMSKDNQKQLFATTHSKECIQSFAHALKEKGLEAEGRIIRLADTPDGIMAYTMRYTEFENALNADSEIR